MDMLVVPIGGFFPLLQHEIYFVVLDADEGSAFLTSQSFVSFYFDLATLVAVIGRFTKMFSRSHLHFSIY